MAKLKTNQLRRVFDSPDLKFKSTEDIEPCTTIIGQPRGVMAIEFGIEMESPGYNIFVLGESGTGRTTTIKKFIEGRVEAQPVPNDWIYVNNFQSPHSPFALMLPAGEACRLRDSLAECISRLRLELSGAFDNEQFRDEALAMRQQLEAERNHLMSVFQRQANSQGAAVIQTPEGFRILPTKEGQQLDAEGFNALSDEEREAWRVLQNKLEKELADVMHQARAIENSVQDGMEQLIQRVGASVVDVAIMELTGQFKAHAVLTDYFQQLRDDILKNINLFRQGAAPDGQQQVPAEWFRRYQINVIVDHKMSTKAPVIVEYDPTLPRLLGRVEHEARPGGAVVTDFTLLQPGALHSANGGYLVLRARDLFAAPMAYESLKRALLGNAVRPDDPAIRGGAATRTLDPQPIPLDIKVILIGPPSLYYQLAGLDEDFDAIFKVMADFDQTIERNHENEMEYATFMSARIAEKGLRPFDRSAIGKVIEYGSRLAGDQKRLSTKFGNINDLLSEANHWAEKSGKKQVTAEDISKAIETRIYMRNRIEIRMREGVLAKKQLLTTTGAKIGQINGLAVSQVGDYAFGHPSRLTARTYVGKNGVVAIDREVNMAGAIHNKGVLILTGYLGGQYATDHPLSLSAQITFEQNYGGVDGDSASSTELYALLSSLTEIPIKQNIAVTGSVNQYGEVQAIGGATQKIEGWYEVCLDQGLTGEQGAMIPASNVSDLMLRDEVVAAVEAGKFHLWAVETIDEGIEVMLGQPAAVVHAKAQAKLTELAGKMAKYDE
ncbi:MAG: lon-related putative ATP-dependent protease [Cellvibrionaceae bacterium]|jgi:lon-related putative ATP-dependent protease